jgi:hypothetical protein
MVPPVDVVLRLGSFNSCATYRGAVQKTDKFTKNGNFPGLSLNRQLMSCQRDTRFSAVFLDLDTISLHLINTLRSKLLLLRNAK